jgi:hemolysin III
MGIVWALAVIGILLDTIPKKRPKVLTLVIYLGMGWAIAFDYSNLQASLPEAGVTWLTAGGIAYTLGVIFYVADKTNKIPHAHGIWHFFVLAGSICHFVSVMGFVR